MLSGHAGGVAVRGAFAPREEIGGGGALDRAHAVDEDAREARVVAAGNVPEREVLGIEGALGEHGRGAQFTPSETVGGGEGVEAAGGFALLPVRALVLDAAEGLVALVEAGGGIQIEEGREVVRLNAAPDDVVVLRAGELDQADAGAGEVNAVVALGDARELLDAMVGNRGRAAIIEADFLAFWDDGKIRAGRTFPRAIGGEDDLATHGLVEFEGEVFFRGDEEFVDEEFPAVAEVEGWDGGEGREGEGERGTERTERDAGKSGADVEGHARERWPAVILKSRRRDSRGRVRRGISSGSSRGRGRLRGSGRG